MINRYGYGLCVLDIYMKKKNALSGAKGNLCPMWTYVKIQGTRAVPTP